MGWESKVANQMLSYLCLFKNTPSWMALVALLLIFSSYLLVGFGFFSILYTSLVVFLSTVIYTASKHKAVQADKLVEEKVLSSKEESSDQRENIAPTQSCKHEAVTVAKEAQEEVKIDDVASHSTTSSDLQSESADCSDGSISDEDSLIEIALPSGQYVGDQQKGEPKYNFSLQQKKRELSAEALFTQQSLMELLAELNDMSEEENLIEIDISMGSIKYSRFEIKA